MDWSVISLSGDEFSSKAYILLAVLAIWGAYRAGRVLLGHQLHNGQWLNRQEALKFAEELKSRRGRGIQISMSDAQFLLKLS